MYFFDAIMQVTAWKTDCLMPLFDQEIIANLYDQMEYEMIKKEGFGYVLNVEYYRYLRLIFTVWTCYLIVMSMILYVLLQDLLVRTGMAQRIKGVFEQVTRKYMVVHSVIYKACSAAMRFAYKELQLTLENGPFENGFAYGIILLLQLFGVRLSKRQTSLLYHYSGIIILVIYYAVLTVWSMV